MTSTTHLFRSLDRDELGDVCGGDRAELFQGQLCSEAAWRDRRANPDQWASPSAAEASCNSREPNSWAAQVNRGLDTMPWHRYGLRQ